MSDNSQLFLHLDNYIFQVCLPTLLYSIWITQPSRYDRWFLLYHFSGPHIPIYLSAVPWSQCLDRNRPLHRPQHRLSLSLSIFSPHFLAHLSQVKFYEGLENTSLSSPQAESSLTASKGKLTKHDAITVICSALNDPYHGIIIEVSSTLAFLPLTLLPFTYLAEKRTSSTVSTTSSSSTLTCRSPSISHPWPSFFHLFTGKPPAFSQRETQLSCRLFWLRHPRSHQKHNPVDICIMGMIAFTCIHKRNTNSLLSLCIAIINYALLCGYPPFSCWQPHCPLSAECRPQNWTRFRSSPTLHSTCCHPRFTALPYFLGGFTLPLAYHHWYAIPRQFPPPHLRQIRNPRQKWNSAVTGIRAVDSSATLLLLRVAWAFNYL